ncbi:MAG TPA: N,N-dimethylformamidase beta subunit family domain-containing protein [Acidimicrobiales bacterium]
MDNEVEYGTAGQMRPAPGHDSTTPSGSPLPAKVPRLPQHVYIRRRVVLGGLVAAAGAGATLGVSRLLGDRASAGTAQASDLRSPPPEQVDPPDAAEAPALPATGFIAAENALPGTSEFAVKMEKPFVDMLHAWCDHDSARSGDTVTIFATTKAKTFTAEAFRFGWYGGKTGRRVWQAAAPIDGLDQKPPTVDPKTNMRSCAHWEPSFTVDITNQWPPGMYLFRLIGADGGNTFVPLTILDDRQAPVLVVSAITTWNAYNLYGGASLYEGEHGRSQVVTFDRPYDQSGSGHFFGGEYELVQMIESMGIDVAYTTNVDLHARPDQIAAGGYKAIISLAHDEYYSVPIRHALQSARDDGVNLMFLGANAGFRRIRLEESRHGPHRLEVNYRVAKDDPLYGKGDQSLVTAEWRSGPAADPEAGLVGNYYESNPVKADMVVVNPDSWILAGTGLKKGSRLKDMVQNEYDRVTPEVKGTPYNIEVICHSPVVCRGKASFADVTYYTATSGAGVFATGTLWWERQLGALCDATDAKHTDACIVRQITANVLRAFVAGPAGLAHPSKSNLLSLGIRRGYVKAAPRPVDEKPST